MAVAPEVISQGLSMWPSAQAVVIKTQVGGYWFDAILSANHESTLTVTQHPVESGAAISDHAYLNPARLTLQVAMTDLAQDIYPGQFSGPGSRSVTAYQLLLDLQASRIPMKVVTRLRSYDNMIVESISSADDNSTALGLKATVTLREIFVATVTKIKISARPHVTDSTPKGNAQVQKAKDIAPLKMLAQVLGIDLNTVMQSILGEVQGLGKGTSG